MLSAPELTNQIRHARRLIESLAGVELHRDFEWVPEKNAWSLVVSINIETNDAELIPEQSRWWVFIDKEYPFGKIKFYPASQGGIKKTFPHQSFNGIDTGCWRSGEICIREPQFVLGRNQYDSDPIGNENRLSWYFDKAKIWLNAASKNELLSFGDNFELPHFVSPTLGPIVVGYNESIESYKQWQDIESTFGTAELVRFGGKKESWYVARRFYLPESNATFEAEWGGLVYDENAPRVLAGWIREEFLPVVQPYQAPVKWHELRQVYRENGKDLDQKLRSCFRLLRDGKSHLVLFGFPVSARVGEQFDRLHWQPMMLPPVSNGIFFAAGFRGNDLGYWMRDRKEVVGGKDTIDWRTGENWNKLQTTVRGRLDVALSEKKIAIIGAGAVGSVLAEMLCRAGATKLTLVDDDQLQHGNICRHSLGASELGENKAESLAYKLNREFVHASCQFIKTKFPSHSDEDLAVVKDADLVIDCTGSDSVFREVALFDWLESTSLFSISLGYGARRLYTYGASASLFSCEDFSERCQPFMKKDANESDGKLIHGGIGCWHVAFPARVDDVWMFSAAAIKLIEEFDASSKEVFFAVLEQNISEVGFGGISRKG